MENCNKTISSLYKRDTYTVNACCVLTNMYEYDISKANISFLLQKGYIDIETYNYFLSMDKYEREVKVGYMQRNDKNILQCINQSFVEYRKLFIETNQLTDEEIISIRRDAIITTRPVNQTQFGYVRFVNKNSYTLMCKLMGLEVYFSNESDEYVIDIKGIKDDKILLHENGILNVLCKSFDMLCASLNIDTLKYLANVSEQYRNRQLPIEYYREFNWRSMFKIDTFKDSFYVDLPDASILPYIDITYNDSVIRELVKIVLMMDNKY